jgi:hypothetical protein
MSARSARSARSAAVVAVIAVVATLVTSSASVSSTSSTPSTSLPSSTTSTTTPPAVALYPLGEFIGRWNEANALVAGQMTPSVNLPIDGSALVIRPVNDRVSFFDWHFPLAGYVGGLVDNRNGDVYLAVVAGDPDSSLMRSAVGTLLFMLTAERPDDTATFSDAYLTFISDPHPGAADYLVAGPLGVSMLAFGGVEPGAPWVAVAAAAPTEEARALVEAAVVARLVADTAEPPAPAPDPSGTDTATTAAPAGVRLAVRSVATTTGPASAATAEPAAAPATATADAPAQLHASLSSFVTDWNFVAEQIASIRPDVAAPVVTESAFVRETSSVAGPVGGSELFAARLGDSGFVGGALDQSGAVVAVVVGGDPSSTITSAAVAVPLVLDGQPEDSIRLSQTYSDLLAGADDVNAEYVLSGTNGFSFLLVPGAQPDDPWTAVTVAAAADPAAAFVASYELTLAVGSLALSAPAAVAPTSSVGSPATTAPIAALPAPVATIAATTTGLPQVSLAPPPVTVASSTTASGPPPTTAAPVAGALFASIEDLAARWNEQAAASAPAANLALSTDNMVLVVTGEPRDVFAGWIDDTSYLGGAAHPETEDISLLAVVVVPSRPTTADVLTTTAELVAPDTLAGFMTSYVSVLGAAPDTHVYLPAGSNDLVFSVLQPTVGGEHLIAVTAAPLTDDATAIANARWINETLPHTLRVLE